MGLDPGPDEVKMFQEEFLADAADHLLTLARRLQTKHSKTSEVSVTTLSTDTKIMIEFPRKQSTLADVSLTSVQRQFNVELTLD